MRDLRLAEVRCWCTHGVGTWADRANEGALKRAFEGKRATIRRFLNCHGRMGVWEGGTSAFASLLFSYLIGAISI